MTAAIAVRVAEKIVIASDQRIMRGSNLASDAFGKYLQLGSLTAVFAGDVGGFQSCARLWIANEVTDLSEAAAALAGQDWEAIVADRSFGGFLGTLTNDGALVPGELVSVGSGGEFLAGYVLASPKPKTVRAAKHLLRKAMIACSSRDLAVSAACSLLVV